MRTVDKDMVARYECGDNTEDWLKTFSMQEWNELPTSELRLNMKWGVCMLIHDTGLNAGWDWNMQSACRLKTGASFVDTQSMPLASMFPPFHDR